MQVRTNYIIAAWPGPRRTDPRVGAHYLETHLQKLSELNHSLSQITVVVPYYPGMSVATKKKLAVRPKINNTPIVYLFKENQGLSYGSWSHAYMQTRGNFDYYFFTEDDYVYVADNFDSTLVNMFRLTHRCGYLCTLVKDTPGHTHAAISNGISSQIILELIVKKYGNLPHGSPERNHYNNTGNFLSPKRSWTLGS